MALTATTLSDRMLLDFEPLISDSHMDADSFSDGAAGAGSESEESEESECEEEQAGRGESMWSGKGRRPREEGDEGVLATQLVVHGDSGSSSSSTVPPPPTSSALVVTAPPAPPQTLVIAPEAQFSSPQDIFRAFATMTHHQMQFQSQFLTYTTQFQSNMLDMQRDQSRLQEKQEHLQTKQEAMQQSLEKMERTMLEMRDENTAVKNNRELRLLLEFIVTYGMDSVRGIVVAFPFMVEDVLCVVVNVPLLFHAMKAFIPGQLKAGGSNKRTKSPGWTCNDVKVQLHKLEFLDYKKCENREEYFHEFERTFGAVEKDLKRPPLDNYVVLYGDKFYYAYRTCRDNPTFLKPWVERDVVANKCKGGLLKLVDKDAARVHNDDELDAALDTKMAWGHEVQEEVLAAPAVRTFFKRMYELTGTASTQDAATQALVAEKWTKPFHFMGIKPVMAREVRTRRWLCEHREDDSVRESDRDSDDAEVDDSQYVDEEVMDGRKRRAPASGGASKKSRKK